jgi:hypothetical protein
MNKKKLLLPLLLVTACYVDATGPVYEPVDLGVMATANAVSTNLSTGTITMEVTAGAAYALQVTNIAGDVLHNTSIMAETSTITISVGGFNLPRGAYDLNLVDNQGNISKAPIIIN